MDRKDVRKHRAAFEKAVEVGLVGTNLTGEVAGSARFDPAAGTITFKVTVTVPGGAGKTSTDWDRYAESVGADPAWLGRTFVSHDGKRFTVVGVNPRAKKYPLKIESPAGKSFKASADLIRSWTPVATGSDKKSA